MVSTRPFISRSSSFFINLLVTVSRPLIAIGITVTFIFHSFFSVLLQGLCIYLSFRFLSIVPSGQPERQSPLFFFFLLLTFTRSGRLAVIRWSVCISKSQGILCVSFSKMGSRLCIIPCMFFPPALFGLSLKSERQQVFSGFQLSSEYSSWS